MNYDYIDQGRTQSTLAPASIYLVRLTDPSQVSAVASRIDALFSNSPERDQDPGASSSWRPTPIKQIGDIGFVVRAIVGAAFFALLFSVGAVVMQSVRERTPELAVLKTLGFTDVSVMSLIVAETLLLCLFSAGIGLGLAALLFPVIKAAIGFNIHAGPVLLVGLILAVGLALISGLPPAIRGMRLSIVDALAGR